MLWVAIFAARAPTASAPTYVVVPVLLIVVALGAYNLISAAVLRGHLEFGAVTTGEGLTQMARLAFLGVLGISRTWATVIGLLVAELVGGLAQASWLTHRIGRSPQPPRVDSDSVPRAGPILRYAAAVWVIAVIDIAIWQRIEIAFLQHYTSSASAGIFNLVTQITQACVLIPTVAISALFPTFAELDSRSVPYLKRAYKDIATLVWPLALPVYGLGVLFTPILLNRYGPRYAIGYALIPYLMFGRTVGLLGALASTLLYAIGKQRAILRIVIVGASLNVLGNFLLVPRFGLMGAATSVCCFQPIVSIITVCAAHNVIGGSANVRLRTLAANVAGIALCAYVSKAHLHWSLLLAVTAIYGMVLYNDQSFRTSLPRMWRGVRGLTCGGTVLEIPSRSAPAK
jgi:O-antigen/teichoic acid export membrane protein